MTGQVVAALPVAAPTGTDTPKNKTVGEMVGAFQSIVTVEYIRGVKIGGLGAFGEELWQGILSQHRFCRRPLSPPSPLKGVWLPTATKPVLVRYIN